MTEAFETERRRYLSPGDKARVRERQDDKCAECGEPLSGKIEFDHVIELCMGGTNDLENFEALHAKPCHQGRTSRTATRRAKADRQSGRTGQWKRRQEGKTQGFKTWLSMSGERRHKKDPEPQS
jgi:hypothetical protein